ncbi:MAG: YggT family protein [Thermanaerothrix sp.]|jgi:YggT family protein|uniref:YggT family protein n=1 Tax=Thermanaerothrix solaris TaxID=3058434 RepID=A0ABU3NJ17_9CHLR|nr:YggT family protein [Thermanaerothrix sp. 4228-RoL]MDT8896849.1 YggT family protein [Thermanaerothrix sp. 4228-RoL]
MMIWLLIQLIQALSTLLVIVVIVDVVLSYFLSPFHPIRSALDRIVEPLLTPIRRIVPPVQMIDFSPIILVILIQVVEWILVGVLSNMLR